MYNIHSKFDKINSIKKLKKEYKIVCPKLNLLLNLQIALRNKLISQNSFRNNILWINQKNKINKLILEDNKNNKDNKLEIIIEKQYLHELEQNHVSIVSSKVIELGQEHYEISKDLRDKVNFISIKLKILKENNLQKNLTKPIPKSQLESNMEDICSICLNTHLTKDTIITCCNHQYGNICFEKWKKCMKKNNLSCPLCKKINPQIFIFRELEKKDIKKPLRNTLSMKQSGAIGNSIYLLELSEWKKQIKYLK